MKNIKIISKRRGGGDNMKDLIVNIMGVPVNLIYKKIPINELILDQENPRIGLFKDASSKPDLDQEEIDFAIKNKNSKSYEKLKESIRLNEGIINLIWVQQIKNKFLIIEGNTRAVIYRELNEEFPNKEEYKKIPSYILPNTFSEEKRDFIRLQAHLRGITPWDSYEKARYLYILNDKQGHSVGRLSKLTKLSISEIQSSIKAFKDMEEEYLPKYAKDPTEVFKYSYFVEYEKDAKLQELMRRSSLDIKSFCNWVGTGKIKRAQDVRDLRDIVEHKDIREIFIRNGYDAAIEELSILKPQLTSSLFENIRKVIEGLDKLQNHEITDMKLGHQPMKVRLIEDLQETSEKTLELVK